MWIFLNDAMVSVVRHRKRPGHLMVRARVAGDLQRAFPEIDGRRIRRTPGADYLYRMVITNQELYDGLVDMAMSIDYLNFKDSIAPSDRDRRMAYHAVWDDMLSMQLRMAPGSSRYGRPLSPTPAPLPASSWDHEEEPF